MISLTTFPARIRSVWATIVTLLWQTRPPDAVVLVLAEDQFPGRRIPWNLRRLLRVGLVILWTESDIGPHMKILPTRLAYPEATIVTADDDFLYDRDMLARLVAVAADLPATIVGHRGWTAQWGPDGPEPYFTWMQNGRANPQTHPDRVFLTGVGGVLYPPDCPPDRLLLDPENAMRVTPTADDVWLWASSIAGGTPRYCTGQPFGRTNGLDGLSPALLDTNRTANDVQIAAAVEHFGIEDWFRDRC